MGCGVWGGGLTTTPHNCDKKNELFLKSTH